MAKINQVKLKQDADAAEKAGRFDKAIDALKQIVQDNPRDWNTVNRIGDLYAQAEQHEGGQRAVRQGRAATSPTTAST